ncbi:hypothetical protein F5884DRAFT_822689 [Xylogone sp. PMI_703]|nr:hypothetical protein F5884DRAFT_822689 [Xylogone sp. PMI_703]
MRSRRFHGLKRIKIRQSWNKHNLYNLSRLKLPNTLNLTFFQQKWMAKSTSRAYHGEQIKEKHWQRMFRSRLRSVVPMDHRYLAEYDGSELAEGRGSGKDVDPNSNKRPRERNPIPYMHMTYAPAERRLDTAIFRALFASSARQARQFVVHGAVKVNGKKMIYPGYLLNPGDMFQVDPERVLYATGAPKDRSQIRRGRGMKRAIQARARQIAQSKDAAKTEPAAVSNPEQMDEMTRRKLRKKELKQLLESSNVLAKDKKAELSAKRKQELRALHKTLRNTIGKANTRPVEDLEKELQDLTTQLESIVLSTQPAEEEKPKEQKPQTNSEAQLKLTLKEAVRRAKENPIDESKPYATPWRPRQYMSAFAFIPRYLEVNQSICSAVYLRHPVARPGLAEVPSPFPADIQQLAYTWYLRRR